MSGCESNVGGSTVHTTGNATRWGPNDALDPSVRPSDFHLGNLALYICGTVVAFTRDIFTRAMAPPIPTTSGLLLSH